MFYSFREQERIIEDYVGSDPLAPWIKYVVTYTVLKLVTLSGFKKTVPQTQKRI